MTIGLIHLDEMVMTEESGMTGVAIERRGDHHRTAAEDDTWVREIMTSRTATARASMVQHNGSAFLAILMHRPCHPVLKVEQVPVMEDSFALGMSSAKTRLFPFGHPAHRIPPSIARKSAKGNERNANAAVDTKTRTEATSTDILPAQRVIVIIPALAGTIIRVDTRTRKSQVAVIDIRAPPDLVAMRRNVEGGGPRDQDPRFLTMDLVRLVQRAIQMTVEGIDIARVDTILETVPTNDIVQVVIAPHPSRLRLPTLTQTAAAVAVAVEASTPPHPPLQAQMSKWAPRSPSLRMANPSILVPTVVLCCLVKVQLWHHTSKTASVSHVVVRSA